MATSAHSVPEKYYSALQEAGVSVEEATKYYGSFKLYDKDGSDTMDSEELFSCLQVLGQAPKSKDEVDKLMKEHDKDTSGTLDFLEFAKLMGQICKPVHSVRDDLVMSFQVFDKDQSGYLDRKELHDAIYSMGNCTLSEKEFDKLMKAADTNGDGKVDYAEFAALLLTDVYKMIQSSHKKLEAKENHGGHKDKDHKDKDHKDKDHKDKDHKDKDHKDKEHKDKDHKDKDRKDKDHKDKDHKDKDHEDKDHKDKDHKDKDHKDKDHKDKDHKDKDHKEKDHKDKDHKDKDHKKRKGSGHSSRSGDSFKISAGGFKIKFG